MVTSRFRSFSVARGPVPQVSATDAADWPPSRSASKTPSFVATTMPRAYIGAYASSMGIGTMPLARTADSTGFSAIRPTRIDPSPPGFC
jgi:hypothetical protein